MESHREAPFAADFLEGVERFERGDYWGSHESWERIWLAAPAPARDLFRGLIQFAAAHHHVVRGNRRGALRLFRSSAGHLEPFAPRHAGIAIGVLIDAAREAERILEEGGNPPPPGALPVDEGWQTAFADEFGA
jgi:uncharacterized protein